MRIQIINSLSHKDADFNWLIEACDYWATEYGIEKLEWLHADSIDLSCDVFFKSIDRIKVEVGFLNDLSPASYNEHQIRWIEIEAIELGQSDVLTQVLLVIIGIVYVPSVTGSFSVDWLDIKTILSHGKKGYCCSFDWKDSNKFTHQLVGRMNLSKSEKILSSSMLLNQGLRINETFQHIEKLMKGSVFSEECLNILNITNSEKLPSTNIFLFVSKENQLELSNTDKVSPDSVVLH